MPSQKEAKMRRSRDLAVLAVLAALVLRCGGEGIVARGGDFVLSLDDLRYEVSRLGPAASYGGTHEDRLGVVEKLAARHYVAREAEAKGYADEILEETVADEMKTAAAAAYRKWRVESSIQAPRIQRLPWHAKLDRRLHLMDVRFSVYEVAEEALAELGAGRSFESLAAEVGDRMDVSVNDMGWRVWRELDLEVSYVVFRLDVKEVSPIVSGSDGYHLFYLELGLSHEIKSLRSKRFVVAMKEEQVLERERAHLIRRYDISFGDDGVAAALRAFAASFQGERPDDDLMGEVVATYPEGRVLVGDLFSSYYSVATDARPYVGDPRAVRETAIDLMMPDLEALAAFDMGMGRSRDVIWAEKKAREDYLVPLMEDYFRSEIVVTDEDLADYYDERHEDLRTPARYKVSRILSDSEADGQMALRRLAGGEDFLNIAADISEKNPRAEQSGELGWIDFGNISAFDSVVSELQPGEISGLFESSSGYEILRLEGREEAIYYSYEEAVPLMKMYITNTRANEILAEWVDRRKLEVGYHIDEDLLRNSAFPPPDYMARRQAYEERQKDTREPVLPKMDR
jgi:parvulin-like peptidyl-prolyl isomerase